MSNHTNIKLVSSELSNLWKMYMFETLNLCVLQHFLATVEDSDIKAIIETKLNAKESRIEQIKTLFNQEEIVIPVGFNERDVDLKAPRLFTDVFMAEYIYFMANVGVESYARAMSISPRLNIRQFFYESMTFFAEIQNKIMDTLLQKGIFTRSPFIPYPDRVDFVKDESFLTGWLGERRPLHAIQISHLFLNIKRNALGKELLTGFSQIAQSEELRKYFEKGKTLSSKLIENFRTLLIDSEITPPTFGGMGVTLSKQAAFSDKLMLNLVSFLDTYGISLYGLSLAESTRRDLFVNYSKIIAEVGTFGEDGVKLMIKLGYMEEPPKAPDRKKLAKNL